MIRGIPGIAAFVATTVTLVTVYPVAAEIHDVTVRNFAFDPSSVTARPGDTIRWTWESGSHTVTSGTPCSPDGLFFNEPKTSSNQITEFIVPEGVVTIPYFCIPHCGVGMQGTISVELPSVDFMITLDGFQENDPVDTSAVGSGTASFDPNSNELSWNIEFQDLEGAQIAAHFHGPADPCENAGVQITLPAGSPIVGSQILSAPQVEDLMAGLWYVNIHSDVYTNGEIRGRVAPVRLTDPIPAPILTGDIHLNLQPVVTGLTAPNWGTEIPGQPDRMLVSDQDGILWSIGLSTGGFTLPGGGKKVFLDVSKRLVELGIGGPGSFDERGLLGVALHPDYEQNGKLYTYTSEPEDGIADFSTMPPGVSPNHQTVVLEWLVPDPTNPQSVVDPKSVREILRIDQPQFNHNAGALTFGPDGFLYIALGDGGGRDDRDDGTSLGIPLAGHSCEGNGADNESILGSIIRIDADGSNAANGRYGIPTNNPFVGRDGLDEIFAFGFRNPFRFSFDSLTGALYAADVGQNDIEEIDIVFSGGNYGWRHKEGSYPFLFNGNQPGYVTNQPIALPNDLIDPIAEYDHDEGVAIVGGFVYRGAKIPALTDSYVFGDFNGRLFYLNESGIIQEFAFVDQGGLGLSLLGMGQDAKGELYALANETSTPFGTTGRVIRLATLTGDGNADGAVDLVDFKSFSDCLTGPESVIANGCAHFDLDENGDISHADYAILQTAFGP